MKKGKKGFSMGEMLVTMMVIGLIAALTIPSITQTKSNALKTLYKSAYTNMETIVNELINDVSLYPSGQFGNNTFCANFFSKVNTVGYTAANCANTFNAVIPGTPNATTTNAMRWYNMDNDFGETCPDGASGYCVKISIDVDGAGKGVNSRVASDEQRDIFDIYIFSTGKLTVPAGSKEAEYLTQ
ncbi:MAG: hypothetical protein A2Y25_07650 [Candidatus Melainabacteria bacterium GWF2_37_15]|nr:MAG: hypothetical protein A2Y25_07650 [Candidatus Melainabacteria bacterium GWF2_37_15]